MALDTDPPLTYAQRRLGEREAALAEIPERIRRGLEQDTDPTQLENWASEKRARLRAEIETLRTAIGERHRRATALAAREHIAAPAGPSPQAAPAAHPLAIPAAPLSTPTPAQPLVGTPLLAAIRAAAMQAAAAAPPLPATLQSEITDGEQLMIEAADKANRRRRARA